MQIGAWLISLWFILGLLLGFCLFGFGWGFVMFCPFSFFFLFLRGLATEVLTAFSSFDLWPQTGGKEEQRAREVERE